MKKLWTRVDLAQRKIIGRIENQKVRNWNDMYKDARAVLDAWLSGVNAGEFETVIGLYSARAILLPTFSNKVLTDHESIQGYFQQLGLRGSISVELFDSTVNTQQYADKVEGVMGVYRWHFGDTDEAVDARFTFITDVSQPAAILHHHSSVVPVAK